MRILFGPWLPDVPERLSRRTVRVAEDVIPIEGGYGPAPRLLPDPNVPIFAARARGGIGGIAYDSSAYNFVGTDADIFWVQHQSLTSKGKAGGYTLTDNERWEFAVFGNYAFAATPQETLQSVDIALIGSQGFDDTSGAPSAQFVSPIRDHLFVGKLANEPSTVQWSAIGNPVSWPTPGTPAATAALSGKQELSGGGGAIQGIVGGAEVGAIFQERAIWRLDFIGGQEVYDFQRVEPSRGLYAPNAAINFGREIFFLAQDGFYRFDYTTARPIGDQRVNDFVLDDLDPENLDRVRMAIVPGLPVIAMAYPGGGGGGTGVPNRMLLYHWAQDKFSVLEEPQGADSLFRLQAFTESLDSPPVDEPLDSIATSFDAAAVRLAEQRLASVDTSFQLGTYDGPGRAGVIQTGRVETVPGQRSLVYEARPLVEDLVATVGVATLGRIADTPVFGLQQAQDRDGKCSLRADGRYHVFRIEIPEGQSGGATGLDIVARPSGRR